MSTTDDEEELRGFVASWRRATLAKDVGTASALRAEEYRVTLPNGTILSKPEELELLGGTDLRLDRYDPLNLRIESDGRKATLRYDCAVSGESAGTPFDQQAPCVIEVRRTAKGWQATSCEVAGRHGTPGTASRASPSRLRRLGARLLGRLRRRPASFQDVAYLPFRPGKDYLLPPRPSRPPGPLPIPPEHLWLGYNYPVHGAQHVRTMLEICETSGFRVGPGSRVLDLGCGAGRMIRHLAPFAANCNIWGLDISAEHILWCKRNLSPPFHFATITKVPHLPFEDASFDLIYCGSVFTHIDDLADAWLLELRRVLSAKGRLYVTIHDEHTIALLAGVYGKSPLAQLRKHSLYAEAEQGLSMLAIGRDDRSQVFYSLEEFLRMAEPMFQTLSVTQEAYFYQTAVLLGRH